MWKWVGVPACLVALAACGTAAKLKSFSSLYAEPADGPVAQLRIYANGMVRAVPGKACIDWNSPGAGIMIAPRAGFVNHNGRDLDLPKNLHVYKPVSTLGKLITTELRASAEQPISFSFDSEGYRSGNHRRSCNITFSFVPKPDANYQVLLADTGKECRIEVSELRPIGNRFDLIPIETQVAGLCHARDFL
ncbi:hypothetical protein [Bordetella trematum]|uniref:hypothetical protein n=1 Tax=Bordetella trematum TaxID=123899 RepID=UPI0015C5253E|nr:hypothetical protein [Bordetella trematum]